MKKRLFGLMLALVMVTSLFAGMGITASAAEIIPVDETIGLYEYPQDRYFVENIDDEDGDGTHWRYAYMTAAEGDAYLETLENATVGSVVAPQNSEEIINGFIPFVRASNDHDRLVILKVLDPYAGSSATTYSVQSYAYFTLGDEIDSIKVAVNAAAIPEMVPGQALVQGNDYAAFGTFMSSVLSFVDADKLDQMRSGVSDMVAKAPGGEWARVAPTDPIRAGYTYGVIVEVDGYWESVSGNAYYRAYFADRGAGVTVRCTNGDYNVVIADASLGDVTDTATEFAFVVELVTVPSDGGNTPPAGGGNQVTNINVILGEDDLPQYTVGGTIGEEIELDVLTTPETNGAVEAVGIPGVMLSEDNFRDALDSGFFEMAADMLGHTPSYTESLAVISQIAESEELEGMDPRLAAIIMDGLNADYQLKADDQIGMVIMVYVPNGYELAQNGTIALNGNAVEELFVGPSSEIFLFGHVLGSPQPGGSTPNTPTDGTIVELTNLASITGNTLTLNLEGGYYLGDGGSSSDPITAEMIAGLRAQFLSGIGSNIVDLSDNSITADDLNDYMYKTVVATNSSLMTQNVEVTIDSDTNYIFFAFRIDPNNKRENFDGRNTTAYAVTGVGIVFVSNGEIVVSAPGGTTPPAGDDDQVTNINVILEENDLPQYTVGGTVSDEVIELAVSTTPETTGAFLAQGVIGVILTENNYLQALHPEFLDMLEYELGTTPSYDEILEIINGMAEEEEFDMGPIWAAIAFGFLNPDYRLKATDTLGMVIITSMNTESEYELAENVTITLNNEAVNGLIQGQGEPVYAFYHVLGNPQPGEGDEPEEEETFTTIQNLGENGWVKREGNTVTITPPSGARYFVEVVYRNDHGDVVGYGNSNNGRYYIINPMMGMVGRSIATNASDLDANGGSRNNALIFNGAPKTGSTTITVEEQCIIVIAYVDPTVKIDDYYGGGSGSVCYAIKGIYAKEMGVELMNADFTANADQLASVNANDILAEAFEKLIVPNGVISSTTPNLYISGMLAIKVTPENVAELIHPELIADALAYKGVSSLEGQDLIDAIGECLGVPIDWADLEITNPAYVVAETDVYALMVAAFIDAYSGQKASFNPNIAVTFNGVAIAADGIILMENFDGDAYEGMRFYVSLGAVGAPTHEHSYTYTSNNNGTHNGACTCGEDAITNQACSYGNDEVCDLCGYDSHEHSYTYTPNNNGTHNGACACGEDAITNQACSYGNDEVCDLCGYDSHEHSYSYTPNNNGTHNGACACGEDAITNQACTYGNDEVCDLCGYDSHEHSYTYTPNNNGTHNGACACGEDAITNQACTYGNDEVCDLCGYDSHVHSYSYTPNNNGTHNGACACGEDAITNQACTYVGGECAKCGYAEPVTPPAHTHSYTYTSNNNGTHNGACTCGEDAITNEACTYVGGLCAKCGYAEPVTPPATPTVNVPISNNDSSVNVEAEISGNDATINPLDEEQIDTLVGAGNASGDVVIDLSTLAESIDTVGIPKATLEAIVSAAEDAGNGTEHLVIKLSTAELKLDDTAMRAIVDQANGDVIKFNFDDVGLDRLNEDQREAVKDMDIRKGYEAYITVNDQRIGDFRGGEVEIIVPYAVPEGENVAHFSVWYIADDGTLEKQESTYDGAEKCFVVTHFSDYVIVYSAEEAPSFMWAIISIILFLLIVLICVVTYLIYQRRKYSF